MNDQPRPVWLRKKQRDELAAFWKRNTGIQVAADVVAAWDAAPADATQAADDAIAAKYQADGLLYGEHIRHMADAVLRALVFPS